VSGQRLILLLALGVLLVVLVTAAAYFVTLDEGPAEDDGIPSSAEAQVTRALLS
jgi:hypothetical protein